MTVDQPEPEKNALGADPRIRFAAERTLLAWLRTGLALMGFGFVVARFGLFLREIAVAGQPAAVHPCPACSVWIGTALIAMGVVVSLLTSLEYYRFIEASERGQVRPPRTALLAVAVAMMLAVLGVVMALYVILRGP